MNELLRTVNSLCAATPSALRTRVRSVAVILTSSRSGSSLLKSVLASHPEIAALDGELEPFLALTGNGFGHNSDSDAIVRLAAPDALADHIFDGLTVAAGEPMSLPQLKLRWVRRILLQFPAVFSQQAEYRRLLDVLDDVLPHVHSSHHEHSESALQKAVLTAVHWDYPWRIDYYDGNLGPALNRPFDEVAKIEEPPFVLPSLYRRPFTGADADSKTLLFKTPSDAYRIGIYEQLFPNADIRYVHLTRGYAQAVNGLMDGWLSPIAFFAHDLAGTEKKLEIRGYSDCVPFGYRWWKFDLPMNWCDFTAASLGEVCLNQWMTCHRSILTSGIQTLGVAFESFLADPAAEMERITSHLGLSPMGSVPSLPIIMATEQPSPQRWHKRREPLLALGQRPEVHAMMEGLGYSMDPGSWL